MSAQDPMASAPQDQDPQETREWLDALSAVIDSEGRDRAPARTQQPVHRLMGTKDEYPLAPEQGRGRRLAHGDRAGQAEDNHCRNQSCAACRTLSLSSGVTSGSMPNQAVNAGRA